MAAGRGGSGARIILEGQPSGTPRSSSVGGRPPRSKQQWPVPTPWLSAWPGLTLPQTRSPLWGETPAEEPGGHTHSLRKLPRPQLGRQQTGRVFGP